MGRGRGMTQEHDVTDEQKQQAIIEWLQQKHDELLDEADDRSYHQADELRDVAAYLNSWIHELQGDWHLHYALDRRTERKALQKLELWKSLVQKDGSNG